MQNARQQKQYAKYLEHPRKQSASPTPSIAGDEICSRFRIASDIAAQAASFNVTAGPAHASIPIEMRLRTSNEAWPLRGKRHERRRGAGGCLPVAQPVNLTRRSTASNGKTDCPSSADFVPRAPRGSVPLLLPAAGGPGRSRDDHRRSRRQAETIAAIRLELGLDRSIPVQFFEYIMRVMRGDLGRSIISNKKVIEELALTIGPTVELMVGGMLIAVPSGMALGHACRRQPRQPHRPHHHGGFGRRRLDAGVLHRPDPDPVCRLPLGAAAVHRPHRTGLGRRIAEPDPARADAWPGADRADRAADTHRRAGSARRRFRADCARQGPARDGR